MQLLLLSLTCARPDQPREEVVLDAFDAQRVNDVERLTELIAAVPCENITLTQAWTFGNRLTRIGPEFDAKKDPINKGRPYPIMSPKWPELRISFYDRPFHRSLSFETWQMTACAICTTRLVDTSGRCEMTNYQILGCISFSWEGRIKDPPLIHDGAKYKFPSKKEDIPAVGPAYPWDEAVKDLEKPSQNGQDFDGGRSSSTQGDA